MMPQLKMFSTVKEVVLSTRPWSFTTGIIPVLVTAAVSQTPLLSTNVLSALAMAVFVQAGANLTNTYYDFINEVDNKRNGEKTLVDKKLSPAFLLVLSILCYCIGVASILPILIERQDQQLIAIFSVGVVLAFFYTASPVGLKYRAMGDFTIFLCFGPLLMQCTSIILTGEMQSKLTYYCIPIGLLTEAIVHANNARDISSDASAGFSTTASLLGLEYSRILYNSLIIGAYISALVIATLHHCGCILVVLSAPLALGVMKQFSRNDLLTLDADTAKMHLPFGLLLWAGILLSSEGLIHTL